MSYKPQKLAARVDGTVRQLLARSIGGAVAHRRFVDEVMEPLRISALLERQVGTPSGGELQRNRHATAM